eukprot:jgi/Phyca11/133187/e_gw1.353.3.1
MGRKLRTPNALLRATHVTEAGELAEHHQKLLKTLKDGVRCADEARKREQERQARYYNRRTRKRREFVSGDKVWMYRPPRGAKASKFVHNWIGPLRVLEPAGYDNFLLRREDQYGVGELIIAHVSFLVAYHYPAEHLAKVAEDLVDELEDEGATERTADAETSLETVEATTAHVNTATARRTGKRTERAVSNPNESEQQCSIMVELRRRRRRNAAGQYVLEVELRPLRNKDSKRAAGRAGVDDGRVWVSLRESKNSFRPTESWKTLRVEKACNRTMLLMDDRMTVDGDRSDWDAGSATPSASGRRSGV